MLNTDGLVKHLRDRSGTELIADLGQVHQGRIGYSDCQTGTGIERWRDMYFVWISVVHQKSRAGRKTRIIKWPYSRTSAHDLDRVLADLQIIENATAGALLADNRGWFARGLDKLIGCEHIGEYALTSPLPAEPLYGGNVRATVVRMRGQLHVTLVEGRSAGVIILMHLPLAACASIRQALSKFASE